MPSVQAQTHKAIADARRALAAARSGAGRWTPAELALAERLLEESPELADLADRYFTAPRDSAESDAALCEVLRILAAEPAWYRPAALAIEAGLPRPASASPPVGPDGSRLPPTIRRASPHYGPLTDETYYDDLDDLEARRVGTPLAPAASAPIAPETTAADWWAQAEATLRRRVETGRGDQPIAPLPMEVRRAWPRLLAWLERWTPGAAWADYRADDGHGPAHDDWRARYPSAAAAMDRMWRHDPASAGFLLAIEEVLAIPDPTAETPDHG